MKSQPLLIGIDVGTGSARAGLFDGMGKLLGVEKRDIAVYRDGAHKVEQSSENIWQAICQCVRGVLATTGVAPDAIAGIGFDATCSLVLVEADGAPIPVGNPDLPDRNIIVWMDHRAIKQAERINAMGHPVLRYVGNRISPEMETPKLLWLKENRPDSYRKAAHFFDLADYLSWRSTGSLARSICTTTCKWTYLSHEQRWDESYFRSIGLDDLADDGFARIGTEIVDPGTPLGNGLTQQAAADLGLMPGTKVAAGLIDAHAGGVGTVGAAGASPTARLGYVFGTSACTMTSTVDPAFVPGVWGPYYSAMIPGLWLSEAGQSAAGAAIDHLITFHPAAAAAKGLADQAGTSLMTWLGNEVLRLSSGHPTPAHLAGDIHVVPEFLGNRAPFADPDAKAVIAGLDMDVSTDSLVRLYVAGICGLGYGLRQIIEAQRAQGVDVSTIVVSGGAGQSPLIRQILADTTGIDVGAPETDEPVLLGSAMLGAVAAGLQPNLIAAMQSMSSMGETWHPTQGDAASWHAKRFQAFELLQATGRQLRNL